MADFAAIYFIRNNGGTYEAYDSEGNLEYSGTALVADVLGDRTTSGTITGDNPTGNFAVLFGVGTFDMGTDNWALASAAASYGLSDILIQGAGMDATIISNSSGAAADTEPISCTRTNRLTIRDLTVSAGGADRTSSDALDFDDCSECLIERVKVTDSRGDGIVFDGKDSGAVAERNIIRSCVIEGANVLLSGIQLLVTKDCVVENNFITGCGENGVKLNRQVSVSRQTEGSIVRGNVIWENDESGIEILECPDNIISGNIIYNNGQSGAGTNDGILIEDFGNGLEPNRNIITGNLIYDDQGTATQDYGVNIPDSVTEDTVIEGNVFRGHTSGAINDAGTQTRVRGNTGAADNAAQEVSGATTLLFDDPRTIVNVDTSGGSVALTLPDNADAAGRGFVVRRDGGSAATVTRAGTDTFSDGNTTQSIDSDDGSIGIFSIGDGEWKIVATEGTVTGS